jgi:hypothetical protein
VAREVNQLLGRIFVQRRKDGRTDLEAVESALRTALHQAGAAALSELLQFEIPEADQRQLPCPCGHYAQYQEIRHGVRASLPAGSMDTAKGAIP